MSKIEANTEPVLATKRTDLQHVDYRNIIVEEGFNKRTKENYGDMEGLARDVVANGVLDSLLGHKVRGEDKFIMTEGHRRLLAVEMAHKYHAAGVAGFEDISKIALIPMRMVSDKLKDRLYIMATTGTRKVPLTDMEKAELYAEVIRVNEAEGMKRGDAIKELVARLGVSQATVYSVLKLNEVHPDIKDFIKSGQISGGTVVTIIKEVKDVEKQKELVLEAIYAAEDKAKATGSKAKATAANVAGLKSKSAILRLKEITERLTEAGATNVRAKALFELVEALEKKTPTSKIVSLFL
jgi:hypothetical protein